MLFFLFKVVLVKFHIKKCRDASSYCFVLNLYKVLFMNTTIVYVLISTPKDIYLEQAYISMFSVKYYMPDAYIVLLTDKSTQATFTGTRKEEIKYVDKIISVDVPMHYNAVRRSRMLKTSVRKYVKGDFLFIQVSQVNR